MAGTLTAKIEGGEELQRRLRALGGKPIERISLASLRAGGGKFRDAARERVPLLKTPDPRRRAGTVKKNIRVARARGQGENEFEVVVGVRRLSARSTREFKRKANTFESFKRAGRILSGKDNPDDPYYWRWIELPTRRQGLRAQPFLRPAFTDARDAASDAALARLRQGIEKAEGVT